MQELLLLLLCIYWRYNDVSHARNSQIMMAKVYLISWIKTFQNFIFAVRYVYYSYAGGDFSAALYNRTLVQSFRDFIYSYKIYRKKTLFIFKTSLFSVLCALLMIKSEEFIYTYYFFASARILFISFNDNILLLKGMPVFSPISFSTSS